MLAIRFMDINGCDRDEIGRWVPKINPREKLGLDPRAIHISTGESCSTAGILGFAAEFGHISEFDGVLRGIKF